MTIGPWRSQAAANSISCRTCSASGAVYPSTGSEMSWMNRRMWFAGWMAPGVATRTSPARQVTRCDASWLATTCGTALSGQTWIRPAGRGSGETTLCMILAIMPEAGHRVYALLPGAGVERALCAHETYLAGLDNGPQIKAPTPTEVSPKLGMLQCGMRCHFSPVAGGPRTSRATPRDGGTGFVSACWCGPPLFHKSCGRPMPQMSTRRDPMRSTVGVGLAVCAAVALYALAVVLLVSP